MKVKKLNITKETETDIEIKISNNDKAETYDHLVYLLHQYQTFLIKDKHGHVKTRSEVRGGGAKPYKQKGTGRARRGTNRSPLKVGGGVIFGPRSNQKRNMKLNASMIKAVYSQVFNQISKQIKVIDIEDQSKWNTKQLKKSINSDEKKLIIVDDLETKSMKMLKNINGAELCKVTFIPIIDLISMKEVFITSDAIAKLEELSK